MLVYLLNGVFGTFLYFIGVYLLFFCYFWERVDGLYVLISLVNIVLGFRICRGLFFDFGILKMSGEILLLVL